MAACSMFIISVNDPSHFRDSSVRRAVRSHAALTSAAPRKSTIAAKAAKKAAASGGSPVHTKGSKKYVTPSPSPRTIEHVKPVNPSPALSNENWSPSLSPQISGSQGRTDPFQTFPTGGAWHDAIPLLVDSCTWDVICRHK